MSLVDARWHKSSYSGSQGECVEVAWFKSSHSGSQTNCVEVGWAKSSHSGTQTECVEVAVSPGIVGVRDTKDRQGGTLTVPAAAWSAFLKAQR
ncbi:DUF397 domain-containing protein [Amycolatopsis sp. NPDC059021]|uniref:DUF397 domain-containing protein n=1 Tax=Amycolatopsis sp. NPDC059021 TaxID=3346704 RepID=UPI00366C4C37